MDLPGIDLSGARGVSQLNSCDILPGKANPFAGPCQPNSKPKSSKEALQRLSRTCPACRWSLGMVNSVMCLFVFGLRVSMRVAGSLGSFGVLRLCTG